MSGEKPEEDGEGPEPPRWAADEPTAMWDESSLKEAGYEKLAEHRAAAPRGESGPATRRDVGGDAGDRVEVSRELTGGHRTQPGPSSSAGSSISWVLTIGIALALGVAVYFLVRFLR